MLTELVKDPFVPNDTHMELNTGRIQVHPRPEGLPHSVSWPMQAMTVQARRKQGLQLDLAAYVPIGKVGPNAMSMATIVQLQC